jgi:hypothetical protein
VPIAIANAMCQVTFQHPASTHTSTHRRGTLWKNLLLSLTATPQPATRSRFFLPPRKGRAMARAQSYRGRGMPLRLPKACALLLLVCVVLRQPITASAQRESERLVAGRGFLVTYGGCLFPAACGGGCA